MAKFDLSLPLACYIFVGLEIEFSSKEKNNNKIK